MHRIFGMVLRLLLILRGETPTPHTQTHTDTTGEGAALTLRQETQPRKHLKVENISVAMVNGSQLWSKSIVA